MTVVTLFEGEQLCAGRLPERARAPDGQVFGLEDARDLAERLGQFEVLPGGEEEDDDADAREDGRRIAEVLRDGTLRVGNLVGAVTGTLSTGKRVQLEILPKTSGDAGGAGAINASRASLKRMWLYANDLAHHEDARPASVDREDDQPLHEWLLKRFVEDLRELVARGMRGAYVNAEDNLLAPRGRLLVGQNIRRNAFAAHRFWCSFDVFSVDRPENRLVRTALERVISATGDAGTRKGALGLRDWLREVPLSPDVRADFAAWRGDRSMLHYAAIRQTCDWLLNQAIATPIAGEHRMVGRLVRMNDVFERYVGRWLASRAAQGFKVDISRAGGKPLTADQGAVRQRMVPDARVSDTHGTVVAVLDMKWKKGAAGKKPIAREDLYQFFAYGKHFLEASAAGSAEPRLLAGVYPTTDPRERELGFRFPELRHVACFRLPFLLPREDVHGRWIEGFPYGLDVAKALGAAGLSEAVAGSR